MRRAGVGGRGSGFRGQGSGAGVQGSGLRGQGLGHRPRKVDFHVHTSHSYDGFITMQQLERFFKKNPDFVIAITDHDEIKGALKAKKKFGGRIIVGEEIKTSQGEIIGLYLKRFIKPGMTIEQTIEEIKTQEGLVMVPHPYKRTGNPDSHVSESALNKNINHFDIIEIFNARNRTCKANEKAMHLAEKFNKPKAVGSDAHAFYELGRSYVSLFSYNGKNTLLRELASCDYVCRPLGFIHRVLTRMQREFKKIK